MYTLRVSYFLVFYEVYRESTQFVCTPLQQPPHDRMAVPAPVPTASAPVTVVEVTPVAVAVAEPPVRVFRGLVFAVAVGRSPHARRARWRANARRQCRRGRRHRRRPCCTRPPRPRAGRGRRAAAARSHAAGHGAATRHGHPGQPTDPLRQGGPGRAARVPVLVRAASAALLRGGALPRPATPRRRRSPALLAARPPSRRRST